MPDLALPKMKKTFCASDRVPRAIDTRWYDQFAFSPSAERYFYCFSLQIFAYGEILERK